MTQNPNKIMIIRHAEKPPPAPPPNPVDIDGLISEDSLIVQGWQRAGALVALFAPARGPMQDPHLETPQYIYASASSAPEGNRPEETITPLLSKLSLLGNFSFEKDNLEGPTGVVASVLSCEGAVLISWPHGQIPGLAGLIPLSPNNKKPIPTGKWPSDRFDMVWLFMKDLTSDTGGYTFHQIPQLLLYGDSPDPIT
jgi:hypothetical protein